MPVYQSTIGKFMRQGKRRVVKKARYAKAIQSAASSFSLNRKWSPLQDLLFNDVLATSQNITSAGTVVLLNGLGTGTSDGQRDGSKVRIHSFEARFKIYIGAGATPPTQSATAVRCLFVYDKQSNGAAPAITDILDTASPLSAKNIGKRERFIIMKDNLYALERNQTALLGASTGKSSYVEKQYQKFTMDTVYSTSGNTVAAIATGGFFFVFISDGVAATDLDLMDYNIRIRYQQ